MSRGRATTGASKPNRWVRDLLRAPVFLYRLGLGCLLGRRFLLVTHVGRKSGRRFDTVLEVVFASPDGRRFIVASGWGEKANWLRNLTVTPLADVTVGRCVWRATARRLGAEEAENTLRGYARRHPRAMKYLGRMMTGARFTGSDENFAEMTASVPLVELRPEPTAAP